VRHTRFGAPSNPRYTAGATLTVSLTCNSKESVLNRLYTPLAVSALLGIVGCHGALASITIENIRSGETLRYPVALLRGSASNGAALQAHNLDNRSPDGTNSAPVENGHFKVLVELKPGKNRVQLRAGADRKEISIQYLPATTPYRLNAVYVTAAEGVTDYITQKPNDKQNFRDKLDTALKLMQTFTAERLNDVGLGRKTFNLEFDAVGKVVVHVVKYPSPAATLLTKNGNQLYDLFYDWIDRQFSMQTNKNVVLMAFTDYDPVKKIARGHTALGGGGQGLFSVNSMCSWPDNIRDVQRAFSDASRVDDTKIADDTAYRGTLWSLASTGIGATLHEMGHTLGLPHSPDGESIMSRGFDHFNRAFTVTEAPSNEHRTTLAFRDDQIAYWDPPFAARLSVHQWLQPDPVKLKTDTPPTVTLSADGETLIVRAPYGIRCVEFAPPDIESQPRTRRHFDIFTTSEPTDKRYSRAEMRKITSSPAGLDVVVTDLQGNIIKVSEVGLKPTP